MIDVARLRPNPLLAGLPPEVRSRMQAHLEAVTFKLGGVRYESGVRLHRLHFATTSVVSLLFVTDSGASTELEVAERESVVGIGLCMGGESTPSRAVVQIAGPTVRLPAGALSREFKLGPGLQRSLLRLTPALITQMSQTAVRNHHHTVKQQWCRWLLLSLDRVDAQALRMTQQLIADMLGVRREGVTEAAGKLQSWGCITYA